MFVGAGRNGSVAHPQASAPQQQKDGCACQRRHRETKEAREVIPGLFRCAKTDTSKALRRSAADRSLHARSLVGYNRVQPGGDGQDGKIGHDPEANPAFHQLSTRAG